MAFRSSVTCIADATKSCAKEIAGLHASQCHHPSPLFQTATLEHLDDGVAQVYRAERVQERVDGGVDVGQPERCGEEIVRDQFRADEAHVVDEVERHPADDVADDDV